MEETRETKTLSNIEKEDIYKEIVDYSFEPTIIHRDNKVIYINQSGADFFGAKKTDLIGANVVEVFTNEYEDIIKERIRSGTEERTVSEQIETKLFKADGTTVDVDLNCHPVMYGDKPAIQSIIRDISKRKAEERKYKQVISEISTPIVPVFEGISVLPLVGDVDEDRTTQILNSLPQKIQGQNLRYLIVDVSGIYNIDSSVIEFLYKIDSIMRLLGVSLIFTGLRPELARKAVETCPNINNLRTLANVRQALSQLTT